MTSRSFDPARLDVQAFAAEAAQLEGRWPLRGFPRLVASAAPECPPGEGDEVTWSLRGEERKNPEGQRETRMRLVASTKLHLPCQRCLAPLEVGVAVQREFLFVAGEAAAAELDAAREEDVLALTRALDVHELVEDELLLSMPWVPLHDVCTVPLAAPADEEPSEPQDNPFAALAALRRERSGS